MKFKKELIWIGLTGILLGLIIAFQYKYYSANFSRSPEQHANLLSELNLLKRERENLQAEVEKLQTQIDAISNSASQESVIIKNLNDDLFRMKTYAGLTPVQGSGLVITLSEKNVDGTFSAEGTLAYNYRLVLELVNELYASGAEAVSINDQRLVNNSEIRLAGRQLNVNFVPLTLPYVIKVIGEPNTLDGALSQRYGIIEAIREEGYIVEVRKTDVLEVPAFNGIPQLKYAVPVKP